MYSCDTLVVGKIESAYNLEKSEKVVALAYDSMYNKHIQNIKLTIGGYFNDDVMVIDLVKWRERLLAWKVFEAVAKYSDSNCFPVQDAINRSI